LPTPPTAWRGWDPSLQSRAGRRWGTHRFLTCYHHHLPWELFTGNWVVPQLFCCLPDLRSGPITGMPGGCIGPVPDTTLPAFSDLVGSHRLPWGGRYFCQRICSGPDDPELLAWTPSTLGGVGSTVNQHCQLRLEVLVRGEGENDLGEFDNNSALACQNDFIFGLLGA